MTVISPTLAASIGALERNLDEIERGDRFSRLGAWMSGLSVNTTFPTSWGPLVDAARGPTVDFPVGPSGRVLVSVMCAIRDTCSASQTLSCGFQLSGANTLTDHAGAPLTYTSPGLYFAPDFRQSTASLSFVRILSGLNPGPTQMQVQWLSSIAGSSFNTVEAVWVLVMPL